MTKKKYNKGVQNQKLERKNPRSETLTEVLRLFLLFFGPEKCGYSYMG